MATPLHLRSNFCLSGPITSWAFPLNSYAWPTVEHSSNFSSLGSRELWDISFIPLSCEIPLAFSICFNFKFLALSHPSWVSTFYKSREDRFFAKETPWADPKVELILDPFVSSRLSGSDMPRMFAEARIPTTSLPFAVAVLPSLLVVRDLLSLHFQSQPTLIQSLYWVPVSCLTIVSE